MRENGRPMYTVWIDFPHKSKGASLIFEIMPPSICFVGLDFFVGSPADEPRRYWSLVVYIFALRIRLQRWITPL